MHSRLCLKIALLQSLPYLGYFISLRKGKKKYRALPA